MARTRRQIKQTTEGRQDNLIIALKNKLGNITKACEATNTARATFYVWLDESDDFHRRVDEVKEGLLDLAEGALLENIKGGNVQSILFFLKTKGRERGYIERTETHITGGDSLENEYLKRVQDSFRNNSGGVSE